MKRQIVTITGSISQLVMAEGLPVNFDTPPRSVSLVGQSLALVLLEADFGTENLLIVGPSGDLLVRLGTTCGTGVVDQILDIAGEIRVIEVTPSGDFQARLDMDALSLERVAEWR